MAEPISLYQATLNGRREIYDAWITDGKGSPFIYPWDTLPGLYIFLGILIRPYLSPLAVKISGYSTLAAVIIHSIYICNYRRTIVFAGGYGLGLSLCWAVIMTGVLLVLHEPEKDYVRLEVREATVGKGQSSVPNGVSSSVSNGTASLQIKNRHVNGSAHPNGGVHVNGSAKPSIQAEPTKDKHKQSYGLIWQPFPDGLWHRMEWTLDLMSSFRGPNWNFRIPTTLKIKTIPPPSQYQITKTIEPSIIANDIHDPASATSAKFQWHYIIRTLKFYLIVDLYKTVMITDPYFLGIHPLDSPSPWPYFHEHPFQARFIRLLISLSGVILSLDMVFSLSPTFFYTILPRLIPQSILLKITKAPLYDPRMYSEHFSTRFSILTRKGLAGLWGQSWHQMFRYGISEPSEPIVRALKLDPRSQLSRAIQLFVAFILTGTIHACASYTTFSIVQSRPLDAFLFFVSQAVGIMIQDLGSTLLFKILKLKIPGQVRGVTNFLFVFYWLYLTGPMLVNDFARAGIWLYEPLPISVCRGVLGQGWWRWGGVSDWVAMSQEKGLEGWGFYAL